MRRMQLATVASPASSFSFANGKCDGLLFHASPTSEHYACSSRTHTHIHTMVTFWIRLRCHSIFRHLFSICTGTTSTTQWKVPIRILTRLPSHRKRFLLCTHRLGSSVSMDRIREPGRISSPSRSLHAPMLHGIGLSTTQCNIYRSPCNFWERFYVGPCLRQRHIRTSHIYYWITFMKFIPDDFVLHTQCIDSDGGRPRWDRVDRQMHLNRIALNSTKFETKSFPISLTHSCPPHQNESFNDTRPTTRERDPFQIWLF